MGDLKTALDNKIKAEQEALQAKPADTTDDTSKTHETSGSDTQTQQPTFSFEKYKDIFNRINECKSTLDKLVNKL